MNQNWLDLGCGKGKLIPFIKKYNPKSYLGLDVDVRCLVKSLKYYDDNQDVYLFNPCDLANNWKDTIGQWFSFYDYNIKYDYVIANFSLMHFFTDSFWEQLEQLVNIGTKFIFNLVSQISEWNELNSFLKINGEQVIYKFEWVHDTIKTEPFISEEKLMKQLEKSKWKVINKYSVNSKYELNNFYTWWIIEKI
jgi:2-polyprenyl-3-methyl-5-hydroxy-6-metoxy-1,4-benzoquinol methylase